MVFQRTGALDAPLSLTGEAKRMYGRKLKVAGNVTG